MTPENKVISIITDVLGIEKDEVHNCSRIADSLDRVEILMEVEREFDIAIPDEKAEKILGKSFMVQDIVKYLRENHNIV